MSSACCGAVFGAERGCVTQVISGLRPALIREEPLPAASAGLDVFTAGKCEAGPDDPVGVVYRLTSLQTNTVPLYHCTTAEEQNWV